MNPKRNISFIIPFIVTGLFGLWLSQEACAGEIDLSQPLTVAQAASLCSGGACPEKPITIRGLFRGALGDYVLRDSDEVKTLGSVLGDARGRLDQIEVDFDSSSTLLDKMIFDEQNYLLGEGIVEVKVKGILKKGIRSQDFPVIVLKMTINTSDINFIKTVRCLLPGEARASLLAREEGCFDFTGYSLLPSKAYKKLMDSKVYKKFAKYCGIRSLNRGDIVYDKIDDSEGWVFHVSLDTSPNFSCTLCYRVSPKVIGFSRECWGLDKEAVSDLEVTEEDLLKNKHDTETDEWLSEGPGINAQRRKGRTVFMNAIDIGDTELVKLLIAKGADVNVQRTDYFDAQGNPLNYFEGYTPLMLAINRGYTDIVGLLIAKGADVNANANDSYRRSPLALAIGSDHAEIVKLLIDNGADVNVKGSYIDKRTPLMNAAEDGNTEIVKLLIAKGANVNAKDQDGWTPLLFAVLNCGPHCAEIVKLLIADGADVNAKTNKGQTVYPALTQILSMSAPVPNSESRK